MLILKIAYVYATGYFSWDLGDLEKYDFIAQRKNKNYKRGLVKQALTRGNAIIRLKEEKYNSCSK